MGKLVRDLIPEILRAEGREPDVRILDDAEFLGSLLTKLDEEAGELRLAPAEKRLEEAADVYEVLLAIIDEAGLTQDDLHAEAARKRADRGGFRQRLWLESW